VIPDTILDLIDRAADEGCLELSELSAALEQGELDDEEVVGVYAELERRGIDLRDDCGRETLKST
jgi:Sigma-70 factor, region 1.1